MNYWRVLFHLARADFLERSRRYSFLITLLVVIFAAYAYLPPASAAGVTFNLGSYRGIYNSAWIGAIVAVLCSALLSLPGFFLIKNSIERDIDTRVGQILATTPISRPQYILGKLFSNFVFLTIMVVVIMIAALVMQIVRGESTQIDIWQFVAPFLFTTLPLMALISAIAILFETIPWLRGGFGNILYFFLYLAIVMASIIPSQVGNVYQALPEPFGLTVIAADMSQDVREIYPEYDGGLVIGYTPLRGQIKTFVWDGVEWDLSIALIRLLWVAVAVAIALLASLLFQRFDPAIERRESKKARLGVKPRKEKEDQEFSKQLPAGIPTSSLTPVSQRETNPASLFIRTLFAEVRMMLKGLRWWWYLIALAITLTGLFSPDEETWRIAYLLAWIWPVLIWSGAGFREKRYHTHEIVFSAAHPLSRQVPATWLAGVLLAVVMASGPAVHLAATGSWGNLLALMAGAAFIPSLALALGIWSGSSKLFEVTYLCLWYFGPVNSLPAVDFMGITAESRASGLPLYTLVASALLLVLALLGRMRQISH